MAIFQELVGEVLPREKKLERNGSRR